MQMMSVAESIRKGCDPDKAAEAFNARFGTAYDLLRKKFPPREWIVPEKLPKVGLSIVAAKSGTGKSWLVDQLAIAASEGKDFLDETIPRVGVLLIDVEEREEDLQERLAKLGAMGTDKMTHVHAWPDGEAMFEDLSYYLTAHPDTQLVIIDCLGAFFPGVNLTGPGAYESVYPLLMRLKKIALDRGICIVLVHHARKGESEDAFDTIMGTHALVGACDTRWVLVKKPGSLNASLWIRGRAVREKELIVHFNADCSWTLEGEGAEVRLSAERQEILDVIQDGAMKPAAIADALGKKSGAIRFLLCKMKADGWVREANGAYEKAANTANSANTNTENVSGVSTVSVSGEKKTKVYSEKMEILPFQGGTE